MTVREFMKQKGLFGALLAGVISAILINRVEPFKSHFPLGLLMAAGVGALIGLIEVGIWKIARRARG